MIRSRDEFYPTRNSRLIGLAAEFPLADGVDGHLIPVLHLSGADGGETGWLPCRICFGFPADRPCPVECPASDECGSRDKVEDAVRRSGSGRADLESYRNASRTMSKRETWYADVTADGTPERERALRLAEVVERVGRMLPKTVEDLLGKKPRRWNAGRLGPYPSAREIARESERDGATAATVAEIEQVLNELTGPVGAYIMITRAHKDKRRSTEEEPLLRLVEEAAAAREDTDQPLRVLGVEAARSYVGTRLAVEARYDELLTRWENAATSTPDAKPLIALTRALRENPRVWRWMIDRLRHSERKSGEQSRRDPRSVGLFRVL